MTGSRRDPRRILLSSHGAGRYGAERVLTAMADGLRARGHGVTLELPHPGPLAGAARDIRGIGLRVSGRARLPRRGREWLRYVVGVPSGWAKLESILREEAPDVVWVNSLYNPLAAGAGRRRRLPVVWHLHERCPPGVAGRAAARWIGACAVRVVAVSEYVAGSYREAGVAGERIRVLPNPLLEPPREGAGVDPEARDGAPFTVLCLGQIVEWKRVPDAVRAVARLPEARLLVVGDGRDRGAAEAAARSSGVAHRVEFAGYVDDVEPAMARADCAVIPAEREGFGLVALEAMAHGLPVVAVESGGLPEVVGDAALLVPPRDPEALARALHRVRESPALAAELREAGLRRVRSFGIEAWLDGVDEIVRDVAGEG